MLLLRAALGLTAAAAGWAYLLAPADSPPLTRAAGLLAAACGASLLLGLMTPFACILLGLGAAGFALSGLQAAAAQGFAAGPPPLVTLITAAALLLTGPGAYSLDARLFGWRQIIIPRPPRA